MRINEVDTFADAYEWILSTVYYNPEYMTSPRNMKIKEVRNLAVTINNPMSNLFKNKVRSINEHYLAGELLWYFTSSNKLDFIEKYSKFWKRIANPDGTCNSAYGYLIFKENQYKNAFTEFSNEWKWAFDSLMKDSDSRQAIIHFNKPWHMTEGNKDFPCTIYGNFHIRNNQLHFTIHMRSSDSIFGTTYDIPFFMLLQQHMWKELSIHQNNEKLGLGSFTYMSNSQHIYEKDFKLVKDMLEHECIADRLPPIKENLINSSSLKEIYERVMNNNTADIIYRDRLIEWLNKKINKI